MVLSLACTHNMQLLPAPPLASAGTTGGPWASMIFAARTDSGVLVVDLGWGGADGELRSMLARIGATPADVRWAFVTHAHRDHIAGWKAVPNATFVLGVDEVPLFFDGPEEYRGVVPRFADRLRSYARPARGTVNVVAVGRDTTFILGRDTLRAYPTPGHTPGSMSYLFRETLFAGDAANYQPISGFRGARPQYSDNVSESRHSMSALVSRLDSSGVQWRVVCTAHAKCGVVDSAMRVRLVK